MSGFSPAVLNCASSTLVSESSKVMWESVKTLGIYRYCMGSLGALMMEGLNEHGGATVHEYCDETSQHQQESCAVLPTPSTLNPEAKILTPYCRCLPGTLISGSADHRVFHRNPRPFGVWFRAESRDLESRPMFCVGA